MPISKPMAAMQEEWREVPDEYGLKVSNLGRVMRGSKVSQPRTNVYLRGGRSIRIYCLVLNVFVGPCPDGMECCHYDDNRDNNVLSNLRWGTRASNLEDRWRNGKGGKVGAIGENCGSAKLTEYDVRIARRLRQEGWSYEKLANKFGVTKRTILLAVKGKTWGHVQ